MRIPLYQIDAFAEYPFTGNPAAVCPLEGWLPDDVMEQLAKDSAAAGGEWSEQPEYIGAIGRTMFDLPNSEDNTVTVLLPNDAVHAAPSQALVRIRSVTDNRRYLGIVVKGPFAEQGHHRRVIGEDADLAIEGWRDDTVSLTFEDERFRRDDRDVP